MVKHGDGSWLGHFDHQSPHVDCAELARLAVEEKGGGALKYVDPTVSAPITPILPSLPCGMMSWHSIMLRMSLSTLSCTTRSPGLPLWRTAKRFSTWTKNGYPPQAATMRYKSLHGSRAVSSTVCERVCVEYVTRLFENTTARAPTHPPTRARVRFFYTAGSAAESAESSLKPTTRQKGCSEG